MKPQLLEKLLKTIVVAISHHTINPMIVGLDHTSTITLQVNGEDMGRCVGKNGTTIWGIKSIFFYAGLAQLGQPCRINLIDPVVKSSKPHSPVKFNPGWDRKCIENLCNEILSTCLPDHASFTLTEDGKTSATVHFRINKYLKGNMSEPSFADAASIILRSVGLSHGAQISTEVMFE